MRRANLLPIRVSEISGYFEIGDFVSLACQYRRIFGRGMVNYSSSEVNLIKGLRTSQISKILE